MEDNCIYFKISGDAISHEELQSAIAEKFPERKSELPRTIKKRT